MSDTLGPGYFELKCDDDVAVATFVVRSLTEEDNIEQLWHELNAIVEKLQRRRVVLDLNSVDYATSSVIGKWIMLHRKLDREGGKLVVCGVRGGLQDILSASKLMNYFNITEDAAAARTLCTAPAASIAPNAAS
jgi:anti-anti-sigma factor